MVRTSTFAGSSVCWFSLDRCLQLLIFLAGHSCHPEQRAETALLEGTVGLIISGHPSHIGANQAGGRTHLDQFHSGVPDDLGDDQRRPGWSYHGKPGLAVYPKRISHTARMGYGSVIGTVLFVILLGLTYPNIVCPVGDRA